MNTLLYPWLIKAEIHYIKYIIENGKYCKLVKFKMYTKGMDTHNFNNHESNNTDKKQQKTLKTKCVYKQKLKE